MPIIVATSCCPNNGTRLWNNVFTDLLIDITILSKVCVAESLLNFIDQQLSDIETIANDLTTITSYVEDINAHTENVISKTNSLNHFVGGSIYSQLDLIEDDHLSITSVVSLIDIKTASIYNIEQSTSSKVDVDITLEQAILSKLMIIDSKASTISASCSGISQILNNEQSILSAVQAIDTKTSSIYNLDQTIFSYVQDINARTLTIESTLNTLDQFVHTTVGSKFDLIENSNLSTQSVVNVIDARTNSMYSVDQIISSQVDRSIAFDQQTQSLVVDIDSRLGAISCSQLSEILVSDQTTLSKVNVIDLRTLTIQSNLNNIYSIDQNISSKVNNLFSLDTSTSSKLDVNIAIDQTIQSLVNLIDTQVRTGNPLCSSVSQAITIDQSILSTLNVIDTRTSAIQSNLNNIYNISQTISSNIDTDAPLQSSINTLSSNISGIQSYGNNIVGVDTAIASKLATLSFCCTNTTSTNPITTSIFGVQVMENTLDDISIQFQYGISNYTTTSYTQGGGTVTTANSMAVLSTTASAGSIAQLQTDSTITYRSGHEAYALFTVAFTGSFAATSSQLIGPIDYQNGFAVGFDGASFGVTHRTNTVNSFTPQSQFNGDKLDGTGPSQFTYNPALLNVFRIRYGYLGSTVIQFQIMSTYGAWITFHTIQYPNSASTPSIFQPFLPITARVENLAGTSVLTLRTASWNGGIIGQSNNSSYRYGAASTVTAAVAGTQVALVIRNASIFNNAPNKIKVRCTSFGGGAVDGTTSTATLIKNATVTGTSFSNFNVTNSVVEVSTAGTYSAGTGTVVGFIIFNSSANTALQNIPLDAYIITIMPGETLTLLVNVTNSLARIGGITWEEQF